MEIQLLEKLHIEACSQLFVEAFSREPWNEQYESDREVIGYFTAFISLDSFLGFVGIESGRVIALCVGMRKPWLKGVEYYIDQFCVAPDFQRRGIGRLFLAGIERRIADLGMKGILLNTERTYPAYGFYRKNGFTEIEGLAVMGKE